MKKNNTPGITEAMYAFTIVKSNTVVKAPAINISIFAGHMMVENINEAI